MNCCVCARNVMLMDLMFFSCPKCGQTVCSDCLVCGTGECRNCAGKSPLIGLKKEPTLKEKPE